jgi:hypothetical protein
MPGRSVITSATTASATRPAPAEIVLAPLGLTDTDTPNAIPDVPA